MIDAFTVSPASALTISSQTDSDTQETEQLLRLSLIPDTTVALSVRYLTEVLTIAPHQIVPIPHLSAWIMGVYNWRGEILWMIDLGHLLGLTPWYHHALNRSTFSAIVIQHRDSNSSQQHRAPTLGLMVHDVDDMEWCNPKDIKPLPASVIAPGMADFVQGCWWKAESDMLMVIDGTAIFNGVSKLPSSLY